MSDKLLDFLFSSFVLILLIIEVGLAILITLHNVTIIISFIEGC